VTRVSLQPLGIIAGTGLSDPDALGDAPNELVHAAGRGDVTEVLVEAGSSAASASALRWTRATSSTGVASELATQPPPLTQSRKSD